MFLRKTIKLYSIIIFNLYPHQINQGGTLNQYLSKLEIYNQAEILATSLRSNRIENQKKITPKILEHGDTIDYRGIWITDTICHLSNSLDEMIFTGGNNFTIHQSVFEGWNNRDIHYMAFRFFSGSDTIYSWLECKVEIYNKVYVYRSAYKPKND